MTDDDLDKMFASLTGRFRHWCPEWDDLPIDETMPEFEACRCYASDAVYDAIKEILHGEECQ